MLLMGLVDIPWWGILIALIVLYVAYQYHELGFFRRQGIPGPIPLPIVGNMYTLFFKPAADNIRELVDKYGDLGYYGEYFGNKPCLVVSDEKMLSEVMVKDFSTFPNRLTMETGCPINDSMVGNLVDDHWKHVRTEITPTFTTGKLKKMNAEINRCAKALADNLEEQAKLSKEIEMKEYAGGFSMDVIASTAFGIRVDSQKDRNNAFVKHAKQAFDFALISPKFFLLFFFPTLAKFLRKMFGFSIRFMDKHIEEFFTDITRQTIEMRKQEDQESRTDFLQLMIKAQRGENIQDEDNDEDAVERTTTKGLTTDEILANALLFFIAGYDTTGITLSFFMYNMATHPDIQEKLVEEIERVAGDKENIDLSIVQDMPFLDQCIQENLRRYPPAIRTERVVKHDTTLNGIFLRKGMLIGIPNYGIHMDPRKWPEPEKFDPERFSPENKGKRNPYHFLPFGYGPRNCIGMRLALQELKVAVIHVLKKVKFSTCERTEIPIVFDMKGVLLKSKDGIQLKVEPR